MKKVASLFEGFNEVAELLIQKGADVNIEGHLRKTALIEASTKGKKLSNYCIFMLWSVGNESVSAICHRNKNLLTR